MVRGIRDIMIVATLMVVAFYLQRKCLGIFKLHDHVSLFYIPAAVTTLSSLMIGYPAAIGVFLGGLAINFYLYPHLHAGSNIAVAFIPALVAVITLIATSLTNRTAAAMRHIRLDYSKITIFEVFSFCLIYSIFNTIIYQFLYINDLELGVPFDVIMFVGLTLGDLSGSFLVFLLINLGRIAFKRLKQER